MLYKSNLFVFQVKSDAPHTDVFHKNLNGLRAGLGVDSGREKPGFSIKRKYKRIYKEYSAVRMTRVIHIETEPRRANKILTTMKSRKTLVLITNRNPDRPVYVYIKTRKYRQTFGDPIMHFGSNKSKLYFT